ncbi:hypothetical protein BDZ91DRAFT_214541 [Kalaharituber pfeilii]|nr:hypothetical protein BDZ91DRAFT_214541 [Kalaharituber pfeilii]
MRVWTNITLFKEQFSCSKFFWRPIVFTIKILNQYSTTYFYYFYLALCILW